MKYALLLILLASPLSAKMPETYGVPWDKALHFSAGYVGADLTQWAEKQVGIKDKWHIGPFITVFLLASIKESFDTREGGTGWNWDDWNATMFGGRVHYAFKF